MANPWEKYGGPQTSRPGPARIQGPPKEAPIQTPAQSFTDRNQAAASQYAPAKAANDTAASVYAPDKAAVDLDNARRQPGYKAFEQQQQIATGFESNQVVKDFATSRESTRAIQGLAQRITEARAKGSDDAPAHIGLVFSYMKILDPSSTVREGEYATAKNAAGVPEQVRNQFNKLRSGGFLSEEQVNHFVGDSQRLYLERARGYNEFASRTHEKLRHVDLPEDQLRVYAPIAIGRKGESDPILGQFDDVPRLPQQTAGPGDIGFSGRTVGNEVVPITPEQHQKWNAFMSGFQKGQLKPETAATAWQNITGRSLDNAGQIVDHFNATGEWSPGVEYRNPEAGEIKARRDRVEGQAGAGDLLQQGAMMGFRDQAAGVGGALHNMLSSPFTEATFDPGGAYYANRDADNMRLDEARDNSGWLGTGAEILGGFASGRPGAGLISPNPPTSLGRRIVNGMKAGAAGGAVGGAGYGEDFGGTVKGAGVGALFGTALGAGVPLLGAGLNSARNSVSRSAGRTQAQDGMSIIGDALAADGTSPAAAFSQMREGASNGVPAMLADSGDNTRGLLAASARHPGPGKTQARANLTDRQEGLADRVGGYIERDLGPATNPHEVADGLMQGASRAAAPLYERAYSHQNVVTPALKALMQRPAVRQAFENARAIAEEEGVALADDMSMQTLDYVKRGLDDVLDGYRDKTSGRLRLDERGRAIEGTRKAWVAELDRVNPDYKAAREAWGGPARARQAMDIGRKSLNMTADDMAHVTRDMAPGELEFFRLGNRRAMVEAVQSGGDQADAVRRLLGSGKKRAMLARLHGGDQEFERFTNTLRAEARGIETNRRAMQGSPTDLNRLESNPIEDQSMGFIARVANGQGSLMSNVAQEALRLSARGAFGSGEAATRARQEIARILSETDPREAGRAMAQINKLMVKQRAPRRAANARATAGGLAVGAETGRLIGQ